MTLVLSLFWPKRTQRHYREGDNSSRREGKLAFLVEIHAGVCRWLLPESGIMI